MTTFGELITLRRRSVSGQDALGNDVYAVVNMTMKCIYFDPGGSQERVQGQDQVITQPTVALPTGTNVTAVDQVTVRGITYEVDGNPADWRQPFTGWAPGIVLKLKGVTG